MKLNKSLRLNIFIFFGLMWVSGASMWLLQNFFQIDNGLGAEPRPQQIWLLRLHGIISYAVVMLVGYVLRAHVLPNWRIRRGLKSGLLFTSYFFLILLTVPFLLYATDDKIKSFFEQVHGYLGLLLLVPFVIHLIAKKIRKS